MLEKGDDTLLPKAIKKRMLGQYNSEKKKRNDAQLYIVKKALDEGNLTDTTLITYLKEMERILNKENLAIKLGFFTSGKIARCLTGTNDSDILHYELLHSLFGNNKQLVFHGAVLPNMISSADKGLLAREFKDILLPYLFEEYPNVDIEDVFFDEGPYELKNYVNLKENDVVIDCGANMGLFSALASAKGCQVYAFEPMEYTINNYLSKTASRNKNISICPYALSDKEQALTFKIDNSNIGASRQATSNCQIDSAQQYQKVQAITLDDFVTQNNLSRVDFIKADIEGAERIMLAGARNVIRKFSPKISICTYHLPDDPQVLREILLDIQPNYTIVEKYKKMYAYIE
jgi:FkbM family methyltransferase